MPNHWTVLGITVAPALQRKWMHWFAPAEQPFLTHDEQPLSRLGRSPDGRLAAEIRDTFEIYGTPSGTSVRLLDENAFTNLERETRIELIKTQLQLERSIVPPSGPNLTRSDRPCDRRLAVTASCGGLRRSRSTLVESSPPMSRRVAAPVDTPMFRPSTGKDRRLSPRSPLIGWEVLAAVRAQLLRNGDGCSRRQGRFRYVDA
jgi:hypothetical protein